MGTSHDDLLGNEVFDIEHVAFEESPEDVVAFLIPTLLQQVLDVEGVQSVHFEILGNLLETVPKSAVHEMGIFLEGVLDPQTETEMKGQEVGAEP